MKNILCLNPAGKGDLHGIRMRMLTQSLSTTEGSHGYKITYYDADRTVSRWQTYQEIWQLLKSQAWDLVYQESSGITAGANLIRAARSWRQPYVISTGDPVGGFFHVTKGPFWGTVMGIYEKLLYQHCAGFIGWTPYLTGMALHLGAKRGVTIEGAVDLDLFKSCTEEEKRQRKISFGLDPDHIVCGVVGSLKWTPRQHYCYGLELVAMFAYLQRPDLSLLIVGDGDGRARLEAQVPSAFRSRVRFTGRIPFTEVPLAMQALDLGFITQTLDGLGNFRLTTKLPEFLACGVPVAMSPIPGFYDYACAAGWPLPALHPASPAFHQACAQWLDTLTWQDLQARSQQARQIAETRFDYRMIRARFQRFVEELV
jgi:Glycosyl transferases group 1